MKKILLVLIITLSTPIFSQDSLIINKECNKKLKLKHFILPTVLMSSGLYLRDPKLKKEIYNYHKSALGNRFEFQADEILVNIPLVMSVTGKFFNLKSVHSWEQVCTNHLVSLSISGAITRVIKIGVNDKRPVIKGVRSFPSGHTTAAFNSATLLFLEYKDDNFWYASSGYIFATSTAFFRITNEKHWVADVLFGAGLGMASAYVVHYWSPNIYKYVKHVFNPKSKETTFLAYPIIQKNNYGMGFHLNIN
jgi:hypothetical protein